MTRLGRPLALLSTLALTVTLLVAPPVSPAVAAARTTVTMAVDTAPRQNEAVYFSGWVKADGKGQSGRTFWLQYRKPGTATWSTLARLRSSSSGSWYYRHRISTTYQYRAYAPRTSTAASGYSLAKTVKVTSGKRYLEDRRQRLGSRAGSPTTSPAIRGTQVDGRKVRYMATTRAIFVEYTRGTALRTWIVEGDIRRAYSDLGHVRSRLGLPLYDAQCNLLEGGCMQRFEGGVIYDNANTSRATVQYGTPGNRTEVFATAKSQVGYAAPRSNISKYNRWVGTNNAWCSIFQSWVGTASGHPSIIRRYGNFRSFHWWATNNLQKGGTPRVGAIAFFDTHLSDGVTAATHAGLVVGVEGSYIHTIEGNTSNPATGTGRGVYNKTRKASHPLYYVYPKY